MKITDKMRLDWLDKQKTDIECDTMDWGGEVWYVDIAGGSQWKATIREAIDAAMKIGKQK